ncbi:hypothetical protein QNE28_004361, partial [Vibrio fluvialis]|nr:hypothetical protein [Vibrio fluvialis]
DDGEANYFIQKRGLDYFIKHRVFSIPRGRGVSSSIVTIKYRHPNRVKEPILSEVSNKLECLELSKFEKELSADICEKITKTFSGFDIPVDGRNVIILSQPLSEDNFISEERKIDIYREISEEYIQQGFNVYLKPHPREYTRYEQHLNEVKVFPSLMPSEVLNLQSLNKFDVGVAIQSTALDNASFIIEKIMLGYAKYPDLLSGKEKIDNVVV